MSQLQAKDAKQPPTDPQVLNVESLRKMCGGSKATTDKFIGGYEAKSLNGCIDMIREGWMNSNSTLLESASHKLKGSSA